MRKSSESDRSELVENKEKKERGEKKKTPFQL